jgi:hypothetical protein
MDQGEPVSPFQRVGMGTLVGQIWSTAGQGADRTRRYQTELLRQLGTSLGREVAGQRLAPAFLDAEEVRGSNPLAPTYRRSPAGAAVDADRSERRSSRLLGHRSSVAGRWVHLLSRRGLPRSMQA